MVKTLKAQAKHASVSLSSPSFLPALFLLVLFLGRFFGWFDVVSFQIDTIKQKSTSDCW